MPELPEVETVRRGLDKLIVKRKITRAYATDSPKSFPNSPGDVAEFVVGASVIAVRRRAKVLMLDLSTGYTLVVHLKMTGQLVYVGAERWGGGHPDDNFVNDLPGRHTRAVIEFNDNSNLYFNDQRKFGWVKLYPSLEVPNINFMQRVGPEPLEDSFTAAEFIPRMRRRNNTTVKAAILDQTTLAGVGNIYADESLWGAKIHPSTRVKNVTNQQLKDLLEQIKYVMNLSLQHGGSTDRNYVDAEGKKGNYLQFANVFRREGLPCSRCGTALIKLRVAGRGTHVCPHCQQVTQ